jgi:hypothetical protein
MGNRGVAPLIAAFVHNLSLEQGMSDPLHDPSTLLPAKEPQHLLNRRLVGPHGVDIMQWRKISIPAG